EELPGEALEVGQGDGPARGDPPRAEGRAQLETWLGLEHLERASHLATEVPVILEVGPTSLGREILVTRRHGVERADLVDALGNQDARHGSPRVAVSCRTNFTGGATPRPPGQSSSVTRSPCCTAKRRAGHRVLRGV